MGEGYDDLNILHYTDLYLISVFFGESQVIYGFKHSGLLLITKVEHISLSNVRKEADELHSNQELFWSLCSVLWSDHSMCEVRGHSYDHAGYV